MLHTLMYMSMRIETCSFISYFLCIPRTTTQRSCGSLLTVTVESDKESSRYMRIARHGIYLFPLMEPQGSYCRDEIPWSTDSNSHPRPWMHFHLQQSVYMCVHECFWNSHYVCVCYERKTSAYDSPWSEWLYLQREQKLGCDCCVSSISLAACHSSSLNV